MCSAALMISKLDAWGGGEMQWDMAFPRFVHIFLATAVKQG
jgi:hypothetical protein